MFKPGFKKIFTIVSVSSGIALALIQFIPSSFSRMNPPVTGEPAWNAPSTRATFMKACGDCHSNESVFPWYSRIAPASWLVEKDIKDGRDHFNISEWDRSTRGGDDAAEEVQKGSMPIGPYLLMHPEANLNAAEKRIFVEGLKATFNNGPDTTGDQLHDDPEGDEE